MIMIHDSWQWEVLVPNETVQDLVRDSRLYRPQLKLIINYKIIIDGEYINAIWRCVIVDDDILDD